MDAGHFVVRQHKPTRWREDNVHPQCQRCNKYGSGEQAKHALFIDRRYGAGRAEYLIEMGDHGESPTWSDKVVLAGYLFNRCQKLGIQKEVNKLRPHHPAAWLELLGDELAKD